MCRTRSANTARDDQRMTDAVGSVWLARSGVTRQAVAASIALPAAARLRIEPLRRDHDVCASETEDLADWALGTSGNGCIAGFRGRART